jgi:hypothetical protein
MPHPWSDEETQHALTMGWEAFHRLHPDRPLEGYLRKQRRVRSAGTEPVVPLFPDKTKGSFHWRRANDSIAEMQAISEGAKSSQDTAHIHIDTDTPVGIIFLSDAHIGDWSTDYELFERITDDILRIPNLYIALLGDMTHMAIKLRGVAEVVSNMLPPELQLSYYESWLEEMQDRIILSTWDNHAVEREELGSGISAFKRLQAKYVPYSNGIGHPDIVIGSEVYKLAVSHRFRGRSVTNPCAGPMRYLVNEAHDREIAAQGDSHVAGVLQFTHGPSEKVAINTGTVQLRSPYARRYFSLTTHAVFPVLELHPDQHLAVPFWSIKAWLASRDTA